MGIDEQIANAILGKVAQLAKERDLDEDGIKNQIDMAVKAAYIDGPKMIAGGIVRKLMQQIPEMVAQERTLQVAFEQRLQARWQDVEALASLHTLSSLVEEASRAFLLIHQEQVQEEKLRINSLPEKKEDK